ncbi:MAG: TetR/AcrR family transcriptional regulator [Paludibacteraceae bacterium]|nr:TetR/AcrR family transcriptional regulator [Candidatus Colousia faecequi]MCQ2338663.1 TetR/AcrR family transcriptional regulator [Paludibacteraceae bacterium]
MSKENTKNLIIETALRLFSERGRKNVNMDSVAEACGKCRRTIYNHFLNIDMLYLATIEYELDKMVKKLSTIQEEKIPADEMLRKFVHVHFKSIQQATERNKTLRTTFYESYEDIDRARRPIDVKEIRLLKNIIDQGRTQGIFDLRESQWTAMLILYAIKGVELPFLKHSIGNWLEKNEDYVMGILQRSLTKR